MTWFQASSKASNNAITNMTVFFGGWVMGSFFSFLFFFLNRTALFPDLGAFKIKSVWQIDF